jgi:hypothetical protein
MKRVYLFFMVLSACVSSNQENAGADSVSSQSYEDFSEVGPFTIKEDIRDNQIEINGKRHSIKFYLQKFYSPDTYTASLPDDSTTITPGYIITEATVIENKFFAREGMCEKRSILFTTRGDFDQEYYDLLFLTEKAGGEMVLIDKQTIDGSQGQSSTIVQASTESLSTDKACITLKVTSSSEGGGINLHKDEWIEYYVADQRSFHPVLKLQMEQTDIQDYEATQDENQNSSSEMREMEILGTSSHGLFDIKVHYTSLQNGHIILDSEEVYTFNGKEYVRR